MLNLDSWHRIFAEFFGVYKVSYFDRAKRPLITMITKSIFTRGQRQTKQQKLSTHQLVIISLYRPILTSAFPFSFPFSFIQYTYSLTIKPLINGIQNYRSYPQKLTSCYGLLGIRQPYDALGCDSRRVKAQARGKKKTLPSFKSFLGAFGVSHNSFSRSKGAFLKTIDITYSILLTTTTYHYYI